MKYYGCLHLYMIYNKDSIEASFIKFIKKNWAIKMKIIIFAV